MPEYQQTKQEPSIIGALMPNDAIITPEDIIEKLKQNPKFSGIVLGDTTHDPNNPDFSIRYSYTLNDIVLEYEIILDTHIETSSDEVINSSKLSEDEKKILNANLPTRNLAIFTVFRKDPLIEFMLQIQMLAIIAPQAVAIIDESASQLHSMRWAKDVLENDIEPSAEMMFSIHGIIGDEDSLWLHTHGMRRTASPDIEILQLTKLNYEELDSFINLVGKMLIEYGAPKVGEIVYPGENLAIAFFPYTEAIKMIGEPKTGGETDRGDSHPKDNLIILSPTAEKEHFSTPLNLVKSLEANPLFFFTTRETDRMQALAQRKYKDLVKYYARIKGDESWKILIKIGVKMDGTQSGNREHLWFEVTNLQNDMAEPTLLNAPYHVATMKAGEHYTFTPTEIVDWTVLSKKYGSFSPDRAFELERILK